jgi:hypothetical protein
MKYLCAVVLFLCWTSASFASDDYQVEVTGGANINFNHIDYDDGGTRNNISFSGGASYFLSQAWELGVAVSFDNNNNEGLTTTSTRLSVGPTFNFLGAPEKSFFVHLRAGIFLYDRPTNNYSSFLYIVGVGHRFEIVSHVTWSPEFVFSGYTRSEGDNNGVLDAQTEYQLIPFQISVLF